MKYRIWATQTLQDEKIIEADSLEAAKAYAEHAAQETGELDPQEIIDGDTGAEPV